MNFEFAEKLNPLLAQLEFAKAIDLAEVELRKLPATEFQEVLGKSLVSHADSLANWIEEFFQKSSVKINVKSFYVELNEFDINTEQWYLDCFAFSEDGGLDLDDMEWLCDLETNAKDVLGTIFLIEGYEKLQSAFEAIETDEGNLQNAKDWCEQIIIARFMELVREAHLSAKKLNLDWASIPIYFTEHAYDFIVKSEPS
ncbi:MAG: hypothetical protein IT258_02670 [Saprospiraceae bacterium]|nr:hypothetical protein [Saprospiraceae bacterium]